MLKELWEKLVNALSAYDLRDVNMNEIVIIMLFGIVITVIIKYLYY